jgi:hypothetical protein
MNHAEDQTGDLSEQADYPLVRWRPWPCESCRGGSTALGFLVGSLGSITEISHRDRNCQIDWQKKWEADRLLEWIQRCPHTQWAEMRLREIGKGSEHLVLYDETTSEVVKITLQGTYGDYYEIIEGRVSQFGSTPAEYLLRMRWWEKLFSTAPAPVGMTESGQIVSRQKFIQGEPPTQEAVDDFLASAELVAVRKSCWLWKKVNAGWPVEVWIGDARSDNFVSAGGEIIPIDIRIWGVPIPAISK